MKNCTLLFITVFAFSQSALAYFVPGDGSKIDFDQFSCVIKIEKARCSQKKYKNKYGGHLIEAQCEANYAVRLKDNEISIRTFTTGGEAMNDAKSEMSSKIERLKFFPKCS